MPRAPHEASSRHCRRPTDPRRCETRPKPRPPPLDNSSPGVFHRPAVPPRKPNPPAPRRRRCRTQQPCSYRRPRCPHGVTGFRRHLRLAGAAGPASHSGIPAGPATPPSPLVLSPRSRRDLRRHRIQPRPAVRLWRRRPTRPGPRSVATNTAPPPEFPTGPACAPQQPTRLPAGARRDTVLAYAAESRRPRRREQPDAGPAVPTGPPPSQPSCLRPAGPRSVPSAGQHARPRRTRPSPAATWNPPAPAVASSHTPGPRWPPAADRPGGRCRISGRSHRSVSGSRRVDRGSACCFRGVAARAAWPGTFEAVGAHSQQPH